MPTNRHVYTGVGVKAPLPLNHKANHQLPTLGLMITGTISVTVEATADDVQADGYLPASGNWVALADFTTVVANTMAVLPYQATALRVTVVSGAGSVEVVTIQPTDKG